MTIDQIVHQNHINSYENEIDELTMINKQIYDSEPTLRGKSDIVRYDILFYMKLYFKGIFFMISLSGASALMFMQSYSRVHISSDTAFLKILKKPSIVQE